MLGKTHSAFSYSVIIALGGFVFGFDASVISGVVGYVTREFGLSPIQQGMVVSAPTFAAIFSSLTVGILADYFGRKRLLQLMALLYTISAIISALSSSFEMLVIARAIGGYAFGSLVLAPIFIAELSPARLRGRLVSVNQLNIVIGLSAAYFVNDFIQSTAAAAPDWAQALKIDQHTWNWMLGVEALPALAWLVLLTWVPRSPRWLAANGKWDQARSVIDKIAAPQEAETAIAELQSALGEKPPSFTERLTALFSKRMHFILLIGIIVAIVQQVTGINIVFFYATTIFEQSGVGTDAAFSQAVTIGVVNIIFTVIAMATIDSLGRKPLMIMGLAGVTISMSIVAWGFHQATYSFDAIALAALSEQFDTSALATLIGSEFSSDVAFKSAVSEAIGEEAMRNHEAAILNAAMNVDGQLILFGIIAFVASFAISLGPVMWVVLSEIFPVKVRGIAISFVTIFNSGASWFVQILFPWQVANYGSAGVFLSYALFAVIGLILVAWLLPETKGLTLEELEKKLTTRNT